MKTLTRCFIFLSLISVLSGCELFGGVAKDLQKGVTDVQKGVSDIQKGVSDLQKGISDVQTQVGGAVKTTTNTIDATKKKVEDVSNATVKLKESLDNLAK